MPGIPLVARNSERNAMHTDRGITKWCFGKWRFMFFLFQYKWTILCIWHMWLLPSWNGHLFFSLTLFSPDSHPISKQNLEAISNICCSLIDKRLLFSEAAPVTFVGRLKKLEWEKACKRSCLYSQNVWIFCHHSRAKTPCLGQTAMIGIISGVRVFCPRSGGMPKAASVLCIM